MSNQNDVRGSLGLARKIKRRDEVIEKLAKALEAAQDYIRYIRLGHMDQSSVNYTRSSRNHCMLSINCALHAVEELKANAKL